MHDKYTFPSSCTIIYSAHSFEPNFLVESIATHFCNASEKKDKKTHPQTVELEGTRDAKRNEKGTGGNRLASIHSYHNPIKT